VALEGNPLEDIRHTSEVKVRFRQGRLLASP
jgi:hypothetical protein